MILKKRAVRTTSTPAVNNIGRTTERLDPGIADRITRTLETAVGGVGAIDLGRNAACYHRIAIEDVKLSIDPRETEHAFWIRLEELRAPGIYVRELREYQGMKVPLHAYQVGEHRIWGATGSMLKNLLDRLAAESFA